MLRLSSTHSNGTSLRNKAKKNKENFGNGRYINHLFDKIIMNHAFNCRGIDDIETLKVISIDDIKDIEVKTKEKAIGFKI